MDVDKAKLKSIMAIDQELEQGFVVLKPFWDYEEILRIEDVKLEDVPPQLVEILFSDTPEEELLPMFIDYYEVDTGETVIEDNIKEIQACIVAFREEGKLECKLSLKDITKNNPSFDYYDANRVILPSDARCDPQNARWIAFETDIPYEKALANADTKGWDKKALEDIDWVTTQDEEGKKSYLGTNIKKVSDIDFKDLNDGFSDCLNVVRDVSEAKEVVPSDIPQVIERTSIISDLRIDNLLGVRPREGDRQRQRIAPAKDKGNMVPNSGFEKGGKQPDRWTPQDWLTIFWEDGGVSGKCLHFDTNVYRSEWEAHMKNPVPGKKKTPTSGRLFNTVGGTVGVAVYSYPIAVEEDAWYQLEYDMKGPSGEQFIFLKGYWRCEPEDVDRHGKDFIFFRPDPEGAWLCQQS